jgi:hypothetical protein
MPLSKRADIFAMVIFEGSFVSSGFFNLLILDFSTGFVSGFSGTTTKVRAVNGAMIQAVAGAAVGATVGVVVGACLGDMA